MVLVAAGLNLWQSMMHKHFNALLLLIFCQELQLSLMPEEAITTLAIGQLNNGIDMQPLFTPTNSWTQFTTRFILKQSKVSGCIQNVNCVTKAELATDCLQATYLLSSDATATNKLTLILIILQIRLFGSS